MTVLDSDPERTPIRLVLRPLTPGQMKARRLIWAPVDIRLRRLLKAALRTYGFECIRCEDVPVEANQEEPR